MRTAYFAFLTTALCACTVTPNNEIQGTAFQWYPLEGGGGPGTVIIEKSNGQTLVVATREWLIKQNQKISNIFQMENRGFPKIDWNISQQLLISSRVDFNNTIEANALLKNSKLISSSIDEAEVRALSGAVAVQQVLEALPIHVLDNLSDTIASSGEPEAKLVVEALVLKNTKSTVQFSSEIKGNSSAKFIESILSKAGATFDWANNKTLNVMRTSETYAGYKTGIVKITPEQIAKIKQKRLAEGDFVAVYPDKDGDGYGEPANHILVRGNHIQLGYVTNNLDCYDSNKETHPRQTGWFSAHRGDGSFDYNCDGTEQKHISTTGNCSSSCGNAAPSGWKNSIPNCGSVGDWLDDCDNKPFRGGCNKEYSRKTMLCK